MNTFKHIFFALFVLFFTITGCKKDSDKPDNMPANNGIEVKNGYLVFKDTTTFIQHMEWIKQHETNPEVIYEFNKKLGFISFSEVYDEGMRISNPSEFEKFRLKNPDCFKKIILEDNSVFWEMPMGSLNSFLSNKYGVFKINNTFYRLTENFRYSTQNESMVEVLINTRLANESSYIKREGCSQFPSFKQYGEISYRTSYFPGWSDRRIVARLYHEWDGNHNYDARTTSQQKHWSGAWVQAKIPELIQSSKEGYYREEWLGQLSTPIIIPPTYDRKLDADDIRRTLVDGAIFYISTANSSCLVTHYGNRYGRVAQIVDNQLFAD